MIIRQEQKSDSEKVYQVVQKAFEKAERCDGNEQDLVATLRKSEAYVPELSLVAEENGEVVAHILFTKIRIGDQTELALAPLSVLPEYQHQGIGTALMARGHQIAAQMGYGFSVVLGSEEYYPKAGYVPAEQYGIQAPFDVPSKNYMALDLQGKPRKRNGTVEYAKEFFEV
ncbi:MAG: N-acetyltransferase [Clostridium sp.]|nr:N-acetyltransferase [Clostridium sp.]